MPQMHSPKTNRPSKTNSEEEFPDGFLPEEEFPEDELPPRRLLPKTNSRRRTAPPEDEDLPNSEDELRPEDELPNEDEFLYPPPNLSPTNCSEDSS